MAPLLFATFALQVHEPHRRAFSASSFDRTNLCRFTPAAPLSVVPRLQRACLSRMAATNPIGTAQKMHVHSPLVDAPALSEAAGVRLLLKMDCVQPSGSYKIRGHGHLCTKARARGVRRFVCSSGGNAGAAVALAGRQLRVPTTIVVPTTTPHFMLRRLHALGAQVVVRGDVWDVADAHAREIVREATARRPEGEESAKVDEAMYISPFDHPDLWEGHASIVRELVEDLRGERPAAIVVSVGGGGLFLGVAEGCRAVGWDGVPILAAETEGADSFAAMLRAGHRVVSLPAITSLAKSLGALAVSEKCAQWTRSGRNVHSSVVSDKEAVQACAAMATHHRVLVEPACGAAVAAAVRDGAGLFPGAGPVVVIVCGGSIVSPALLASWMEATGATPVEL
jgi:L-serine/L-threonine ammonia-lyase